jgi:UPF0271 protein
MSPGQPSQRPVPRIGVDLNADLGEGFGPWRLTDDEALLAVITSANVACGFHAGDPLIMRRVCASAAARGVAIGAQVAYRDLAGFGRRRMDVPGDVLAADVLYQLAALDGIARAEGTRVRYVKAHGALYNTAMDDPLQAEAIAAAVTAYDRALPLLGLPDSELATAAAAAGLPYVAEAFADRAYRDGRLVPRSEPDAVHRDPAAVVAQAVALAESGAASICVHGDTPGAVGLAAAVRTALLDAGFDLEPFAP